MPRGRHTTKSGECFDQAEAARKAIAAATKVEQECKDALVITTQFSAKATDLLANPPHKVRYRCP